MVQNIWSFILPRRIGRDQFYFPVLFPLSVVFLPLLSCCSVYLSLGNFSLGPSSEAIHEMPLLLISIRRFEKFADVPHGVAAISKVPAAGLGFEAQHPVLMVWVRVTDF